MYIVNIHQLVNIHGALSYIGDGLQLGRSVRRTAAGHIVSQRTQLVLIVLFTIVTTLVVLLTYYFPTNFT